MSSPLVTCLACDRSWNSATMADGLRVVGRCPRCSGGLAFHDDPEQTSADAAKGGAGRDVAPHLVLGAPRR